MMGTAPGPTPGDRRPGEPAPRAPGASGAPEALGAHRSTAKLGRLGRLDARPKLLGVLAFAVAVSLVPADRPLGLAVLAGLLALPLLAGGLLWNRRFWWRLAPLLTFAMGMAALVAFTRGGPPRFTIGGYLALTDAGLTAAGLLVARTALAGAALVTLSLTAEGPDLVNALGWFRVPAVFVAVLGSVARTLGLVTAEATRMNRARELRTVRPRLGLTLRAVGGILGSLLSRSLGRAERVHRAMLARGFDGTLPRRRAPLPVPATHLLATGLFAMVALGVALAAALGATLVPWP